MTKQLTYLSMVILFMTLGINLSYAQNRAVNSGPWSNPNTWSGGVPSSTERVIINQGVTVDITGNHNAGEVVVHGTLRVAEDNTNNKSLNTRWMHVNSGGIFQIGTASNAFDQGNFTLTLNGTNPNSDHTLPMANNQNMTINNNDGFLMVAGNGRLIIHGQDKLSFTKLSQTAGAGANSITVANIIDRNHDGVLSAAQDGQLNWEVGDQIVIASSSEKYEEEDVRTITAIQNLGSTTRLTLNQGLTYRHYGEIETYANNYDQQSMFKNRGPISIDMRAEVALLSRNVKIQGLASQDTDNKFGDRQRLTVSGGKASNGVGGNIMIMPTAGVIEVEGVQLDLMGQSGRLGRYPFHWHIARDRSGDYFKNSSITNSNNRAVVVHTTDNVLVEGIVAHDVHGHCFFTEDGVEENNRFINNIAYGVHRVSHVDNFQGNAFIVDDTDRFHDGGDRFRTTAAYWIANANNEFTGNVCAGSQGSGYWFAFPTDPRGPAGNLPEYSNYKPKEQPLLKFKDNSVHSTVTGFVTASRKRNNPGEFLQNERFFGNIDPVFENLTVYQAKVGVYPLNTNITHIFKNFKAADIETINNDSDPTLFDGGLFVGYSRGNKYRSRVIGTVFYHGNTVFRDIHIAGFNEGHQSVMFKSTNGNRVRPACEVQGLSFEGDGSYPNMLAAQITNYRNTREVYDRDGSLTTGFGGGAGYTFIGNDPWMVTNENAPNSGFQWVISQKRFGNLQTRHGGNNNKIPRITLTAPHGQQRNFTIEDLGHRRAQLQWEQEYKMDFPDGYNPSQNELELTFHQWSQPRNTVGIVLRMVNMGGVIKPRGTINNIDLPELSSLDELRNSNRDGYHKSGNDLYVRLMNRTKGIHEGYVVFIADDGTNNNNGQDSNPIPHNPNPLYDQIDYDNPVVEVASVSLDQDTATISEGEEVTLSAVIAPANATNKAVRWSSNDNAVATVENGVVTGVSAGTAVITVTTVDGSKTDVATITVEQSDNTVYELSPIHDAYLQGTTAFNNGDLRVESGRRTSYLMFDLSNLSGSISKAELLLSVGSDPGSGEVRINLGNGNSWTETTLSASNAPASGAVLATNTANYAAGSTYTWALDESAIAKGQVSLLVTHVSGNDISFASKEYSNAALHPVLKITTLNDQEDIGVTGVVVSQSDLDLETGGTFDLNATVSPSNATNQNISWGSSDDTVATVDADGVVTAVSAGTATIIVTTADGSFTDQTAVTITEPVISVISVSLNTNALTLESGDTFNLDETILPVDATNKNVTWESNNPLAVTVDQTGNIEAVGEGTATITVTTADGTFTDICEVIVEDEDIVVGQNPYNGVAHAIPGTITATHFDNGGEGVAYHDTTVGNNGNGDRQDTDVDTENRAAGGNIGWIAAGEWVEYTVNVASSRNYSIAVETASIYDVGQFHIEFDNVDVTGVQSVANTGNWGVFTTNTITGVGLNAGTQVMRIYFDGGAFNLGSITFTEEAIVTEPATLVIEAEDFITTGGSDFDDAFVGGPGLGVNKAGTKINYVNTTDWVTYTLDVEVAGTYSIEYLISSPSDNAQITIEVDGQTVVTDVPNNGAWDDYNPLAASGTLNLTPGTYTVTITASGTNSWQWNLDKITLHTDGTGITQARKENTLAALEVEEVSTLEVYPNPARDIIYITGAKEIKSVSLSNMSGTVVLQERAVTGSIDVSALASGVYMLRVVTDTDQQMIRIMIN